MRRRGIDAITLTIRDSTTVVHVSTDALNNKPFHEYLDDLLTLMRLSNADAHRRTGVGESAISKWRAGTVKPSIKNLRPLADGLKISRAAMFVRAGLLEPDDVEMDQLYLRLAEIVDQLPPDRQEVMRAHVRLLIRGAEAELDSSDTVASEADKKSG